MVSSFKRLTTVSLLAGLLANVGHLRPTPHSPHVAEIDSTLATIVTADNFSRLVLTQHSLRFSLTADGAQRLVRSAKDAIASANVNSKSTSEALGALSAADYTAQMQFPLDAVDDMRCDADSLVVYFRSRQPDTQTSDDRGKLVLRPVLGSACRAFTNSFHARSHVKASS